MQIALGETPSVLYPPQKCGITHLMASTTKSEKAADMKGGSAPAPIALEKTDPEFLASLGRRVREIREQRGMARKVLAVSAEVSERYLAALEVGEGNASVIL